MSTHHDSGESRAHEAGRGDFGPCSVCEELFPIGQMWTYSRGLVCDGCDKDLAEINRQRHNAKFMAARNHSDNGGRVA